MVYGPLDHHVDDMAKLNTSSADIYRLFNGSEKQVPDTSFWAFADVRDRKNPRLFRVYSSLCRLTFFKVAEAHVQAFERPEAAGQRYLIANSSYSYQKIVDIIRDKFPELQEKTPKGDAGAQLPPVYRLDTSKATKELGMVFRPLEETIVDTVTSLIAIQKSIS